jgi:hypothetical protein
MPEYSGEALPPGLPITRDQETRETRTPYRAVLLDFDARRVYLSHAREDGSYAHYLADALHKDGRETVRNPAEAQAMVLILTPYWTRDPLRRGELEAAQALGIPLVPVMLEDVVSPPEITHINWLDARIHFTLAAKRLLRVLAGPTSQERQIWIWPEQTGSEGRLLTTALLPSYGGLLLIGTFFLFFGVIPLLANTTTFQPLPTAALWMSGVMGVLGAAQVMMAGFYTRRWVGYQFLVAFFCLTTLVNILLWQGLEALHIELGRSIQFLLAVCLLSLSCGLLWHTRLWAPVGWGLRWKGLGLSAGVREFSDYLAALAVIGLLSLPLAVNTTASNALPWDVTVLSAGQASLYRLDPASLSFEVSLQLPPGRAASLVVDYPDIQPVSARLGTYDPVGALLSEPVFPPGEPYLEVQAPGGPGDVTLILQAERMYRRPFRVWVVPTKDN